MKLLSASGATALGSVIASATANLTHRPLLSALLRVNPRLIIFRAFV